MNDVIKFAALRDGAKLPVYGSSQAAGADIYACLLKPVVIDPGNRVIINTGWGVELPDGFEMQIRPRSGLAMKFGVTVLNSPGTVDADYRGEVGVMLINFGIKPFVITHGDRIAQCIFGLAPQFSFAWTDTMSETHRGTGGFGSTGVGG